MSRFCRYAYFSESNEAGAFPIAEMTVHPPLSFDEFDDCSVRI